MTQENTRHGWYLTLLLGLLSAIGPLSLDMYLPALPAIEADMQSNASAVQLTLIFYFLGFGAAQLFYGPLADQAGRKLPLYIGLTLFTAGSIVCALASDIWLLNAARFVQGVGGAVAMVIPRAIIRDRFTGVAATRLMGTTMMVVSVSPMLAPMFGSLLLSQGGWRMIFAVLAVLAVAALLLISFGLEESLPEERRERFNLASFRSNAARLLSDKEFMGLTLIGGFGMASFFVFIASASFVYTSEFGLSPFQFGLAFAANGLGFFLATQAAAPLQQRLGPVRLVQLAVASFVTLTATLAALSFAGLITLPVIIGLLFLAFGSLGLVLPTVTVLSLEKQGRIAGLAASLGGTLQMLAGSIMIALASPFFDGSTTPMTAAIAVCAVIVALLTLFTFSRTTHGDASAVLSPEA